LVKNDGFNKIFKMNMIHPLIPPRGRGLANATRHSTTTFKELRATQSPSFEGCMKSPRCRHCEGGSPKQSSENQCSGLLHFVRNDGNRNFHTASLEGAGEVKQLKIIKNN